MSASTLRLASVGETVRLSWRTNDGNNGLFPQAVVVSDAGVIVTTLNLTVISVAGVAGAYEVSYVPATNGEFNIYYSVYTSAANRTAQTNAMTLYEGNSEVLKVRSFSASNAGSLGGMSEDDLKPILKELKKLNVWQQLLSSGRTAEEELVAKSEFTIDQVVKTDIEIPEVNLKPLERKLDNLIKLTPQLSQIKTEISGIKFPDNSQGIIDKVSEVLILISSLSPEIAQVNNILAIQNLETMLVAQQQTIVAINNEEVLSATTESSKSILSVLEVLKSSIEAVGSVDSLQDKFNLINKNIGTLEKNLKQLSGEDRKKMEGIVHQIQDVLKGISSDIGNIKEKDGILGTIKKLTQMV